MKKITGFLAGAILVVTLTSCKKDYTCTCVVNKKTYSYSYKSETKGEALDACNQQEAAARLVDKDASCAPSKD